MSFKKIKIMNYQIMKNKNCCMSLEKEILRDKIQKEGQNMEDQIFISRRKNLKYINKRILNIAWTRKKIKEKKFKLK